MRNGAQADGQTRRSAFLPVGTVHIAVRKERRARRDVCMQDDVKRLYPTRVLAGSDYTTAEQLKQYQQLVKKIKPVHNRIRRSEDVDDDTLSDDELLTMHGLLDTWKQSGQVLLPQNHAWVHAAYTWLASHIAFTPALRIILPMNVCRKCTCFSTTTLPCQSQGAQVFVFVFNRSSDCAAVRRPGSRWPHVPCKRALPSQHAHTFAAHASGATLTPARRQSVPLGRRKSILLHLPWRSVTLWL